MEVPTLNGNPHWEMTEQDRTRDPERNDRTRDPKRGDLLHLPTFRQICTSLSEVFVVDTPPPP